MSDRDISTELQQQVAQSVAAKSALNICGGNSKNFYGWQTDARCLDVSGNQGIVHYEPTELVITARAGTRLEQIEETLAGENQMLGFEPPAFGRAATLGGTVACNLSGPRRAFSGSVRDFMLGCRIINGKAELLHFGGEVMKNVAGYDVSRLMCGALGTLGVLVEVSLKVLPRPERELTLVYSLEPEDALRKLHQLARKPLPLSASCFDDDTLYLRLSGSEAAVQAASAKLGGERLPEHNSFWQQLKEQQLDYFRTESALWRISLLSSSPLLQLPGRYLYEWNGALRWLCSEEKPEVIRDAVGRYGGHAVCFRNHGNRIPVFHPLDPGLARIHRRLKAAFDPHGVLNPARMYAEF